MDDRPPNNNNNNFKVVNVMTMMLKVEMKMTLMKPTELWTIGLPITCLCWRGEEDTALAWEQKGVFRHNHPTQFICMLLTWQGNLLLAQYDRLKALHLKAEAK